MLEGFLAGVKGIANKGRENEKVVQAKNKAASAFGGLLNAANKVKTRVRGGGKATVEEIEEVGGEGGVVDDDDDAVLVEAEEAEGIAQGGGGHKDKDA